MKTYKDKQGSKYRQQSGKWQILQGGGWRDFESTAYTHVYSEEDDAIETLVIKPTPQTEPPEVIEQKQYAKQRENELFVHYSTVAFERSLTRNPGNNTPISVSRECCDLAQAMIDELKKRGRL